MNRVILMGRLTTEPTMKTLPSQHTVSNFTIATDRKYQKETTDFISCIAWNKTAEFICRYFGKGQMIAVEGELQTRTWEDGNGKKRYATEVVVSDVYFCGSKKEIGSGEPNGTVTDSNGDDFFEMDFSDDDSDLPF